MKLLLPLLALLLISCDPEKHDIDKGIQEMAEYREEVPVEDTMKVDCVFDTSYYKLTMAAIRGVPDAKDVQWLESEHTAVINWRGDEVRRKRGGCALFSDDLVLITKDTTALTNGKHWLNRARGVATHFGVPYFAQAIAEGKYELDPTMSDAQSYFYRVTMEIPDDRVLEGFRMENLGATTRLTFEQYQN